MPDDTPIPDVSSGDPVSATGQNEIIDALNALRRTVADGTQPIATPATPQRPPVVRFHVTQAPLAVGTTNNSGGMYATCRAWDGQSNRSGDTLVYLQQSHVVGDPVFAYAPAFGTGQWYYNNGGDTAISLVWQEVGGSSLQQFKVTTIPDPISSDGVPPYVWANSSTGTVQQSIGVIQAHAVNDIFMALPCPQILNSGLPLLDSNNKSIGMIEVGNYGTMFCVDLSVNASSGSPVVNYTYDMKPKGSSTILKGNLTADNQMFANFNHSQASTGTARLDNGGHWILVIANEQLNNC